MAHRVLAIGGSPSLSSRTARLLDLACAELKERDCEIDLIKVRDLPPEALVHADMNHPAIVDAVQRFERADGVVLATPIYKAAYSGVLKSFLDLLPQFGLLNKTVLPLATGGSLAHVLAIDYAMRPVLSSLGARHIVEGLFVLDKMVETDPSGATKLDPDMHTRLKGILDNFARALRAHAAV
jgi:FMN reductase